MKTLLIKKMILTLSLISSLLATSAQAAFEIPAYESYKMKNGLQVYLMQQTEVPLIDVRLTLRAGAIDDSNFNGSTKYGLASITGDALKFGSDKLTKTEIEDQLAFYGANLNARTDAEMTTLSMSLAAKDQNKLLQLFRDVALKPTFSDAEFVKFKKRYINQLKQRRESPKNIISNIFSRLHYAEHPYGNPVSGDTKSVETIDLDDIKAFYKQFYTPRNSALIIVGDFESKAMKNQLEKLFGQWKGKAFRKAELPSVIDKSGSNLWLLNKDDANETTFMIGGKGLSTKDPDFVAAQVLNTILGGRFTSWLNDELRVNSGLTYGARSHFSDNSTAGSFYISTFTKKESTFEALDLAIKTYQRLWLKGIDTETLESAKAYIKGQFPPRYETGGQLAYLLSRMWALNLDASMINEFEQRVNALDVKKANALVKKIFPTENLQYVLIGKSSELKEKAKQYGKVKEMDINDFSF